MLLVWSDYSFDKRKKEKGNDKPLILPIHKQTSKLSSSELMDRIISHVSRGSYFYSYICDVKIYHNFNLSKNFYMIILYIVKSLFLKTELPPVNRKLKPKPSINNKLPEGESENQCLPEKPIKKAFIESSRPPSVDRNLKPNVYKVSHYDVLENIYMYRSIYFHLQAVNSSLMEHGMRRSVDMSFSIEITPEVDECILETRTLPRKITSRLDRSNNGVTTDISVLHHRSKSAANSMYQESVKCNPLQKNTRNEHRLQYFDLDVTNPPTINRQSISTSNLTKEESSNVDLLPENSLKSGVVYNSVDFVKTEAFKRIREERKKESEGLSSK